MFLFVSMVMVACGDESPGLTRTDVEEIVRAEMAEVPASPQAEPGLTAAEVEEAIHKAMAEAPQTDSGLSRAEVQRIVTEAIESVPEPGSGLTKADVEPIVREVVESIQESQPQLTISDAELMARSVLASVPSRSAPAAYTKYFVDNAIVMYETRGLDATMEYYSREQSVDGQWYAFIIDENDLVIGHPDAQRLGLDLKGWVGTDANGYNFGSELLTADESGKWVSYVYRNPAMGGLGSEDFQLKNVWVKEHDGLLFASGWYINADDFTKLLVETAVSKFQEGGLEAAVAYFAGSGTELAGLEAAIDYYNSADTVEGQWFAFIADDADRIAAHSQPQEIGQDLLDVLGLEVLPADSEGGWVTTDTLRLWVVEHDGWVFGSGWRHDVSGS